MLSIRCRLVLVLTAVSLGEVARRCRDYSARDREESILKTLSEQTNLTAFDYKMNSKMPDSYGGSLDELIDRVLGRGNNTVVKPLPDSNLTKSDIFKEPLESNTSTYKPGSKLTEDILTEENDLVKNLIEEAVEARGDASSKRIRRSKIKSKNKMSNPNQNTARNQKKKTTPKPVTIKFNYYLSGSSGDADKLNKGNGANPNQRKLSTKDRVITSPIDSPPQDKPNVIVNPIINLEQNYYGTSNQQGQKPSKKEEGKKQKNSGLSAGKLKIDLKPKITIGNADKSEPETPTNILNKIIGGTYFLKLNPENDAARKNITEKQWKTHKHVEQLSLCLNPDLNTAKNESASNASCLAEIKLRLKTALKTTAANQTVSEDVQNKLKSLIDGFESKFNLSQTIITKCFSERHKDDMEVKLTSIIVTKEIKPLNKTSESSASELSLITLSIASQIATVKIIDGVPSENNTIIPQNPITKEDVTTDKLEQNVTETLGNEGETETKLTTDAATNDLERNVTEAPRNIGETNKKFTTDVTTDKDERNVSGTCADSSNISEQMSACGKAEVVTMAIELNDSEPSERHSKCNEEFKLKLKPQITIMKGQNEFVSFHMSSISPEQINVKLKPAITINLVNRDYSETPLLEVADISVVLNPKLTITKPKHNNQEAPNATLTKSEEISLSSKLGLTTMKTDTETPENMSVQAEEATTSSVSVTVNIKTDQHGTETQESSSTEPIGSTVTSSLEVTTLTTEEIATETQENTTKNLKDSTVNSNLEMTTTKAEQNSSEKSTKLLVNLEVVEVDFMSEITRWEEKGNGSGIPGKMSSNLEKIKIILKPEVSITTDRLGNDSEDNKLCLTPNISIMKAEQNNETTSRSIINQEEIEICLVPEIVLTGREQNGLHKTANGHRTDLNPEEGKESETSADTNSPLRGNVPLLIQKIFQSV